MDTHTNAHSWAEHVAGVHHPIGQHAKDHPDALAVREATTGRELTYRDLWHLAGSVAERLTAAGVGPGDACGIALDRGADLVVALLAVARTGAHYVPLDNGAPRRRSAAQLADTGARALIGAPGDTARAQALAPDLPVVEVAREWTGDPLGREPPERRRRRAVRELHLGHQRPAQGRRGAPPGGAPTRR
ncbi:AMP-binding protein [Streptomyces sp. PmtG]